MKTPTRSNKNLLFTRVASSQAGTIDPQPQIQYIKLNIYYSSLGTGRRGVGLSLGGNTPPPRKKHCLK